MAFFPKPEAGSWTENWPELGTAPVNYEDSIDPEHFKLGQQAIFKKTWLKVGRVEQLPKKGSYFTREMPCAGPGTSVIIVKDVEDGPDGKKDVVRAFYNLCRHRGNKLVWNDMPLEETSGVCKQFTCKYHAWRYDLDGNLTFVQQESEFFDLDKSRYGLVPIHCDVWEGFIFVNFADRPEQSLRELSLIHIAEPTRLRRSAYAVACLKKNIYSRSHITHFPLCSKCVNSFSKEHS